MTDNKTTDYTSEEVSELVDAMWQLLNDMGETGQSVCMFTKAKARIAFNPFTNDVVETHGMMSMEEARLIVGEREDAGRTILIPCEVCQREGRILRASAVNPYEEVDCGQCPECDGTAYVTAKASPVTMDDMQNGE